MLSRPCVQVSQECQSLITALLVKDPAKRLGAKYGAEEIKAHPFFAGVNWPLLRHKRPPYGEPTVAGASSSAEFENY